MGKYGWEKHDGMSYGTQTIEDPNNFADLTVSWVKPDLTDPNHWILRVEGSARVGAETDDLSLMWYVATAEGFTATFDTASSGVNGYHESVGQTFWLNHQDAAGNVNAEYSDDRGNTYVYGSDYFTALTVDEGDNYNPKKYFFDELKDAVGTTPPHLADPNSLYRAETAFTGNLVTV